MRFGWNRLALALAFSGMSFAATLPAQAQTGHEIVYVDLNLNEADLMAATRVLTTMTGLQFVVEPTDVPFRRITLTLNRIPAEDAIRYVCMAAGARFRRDERGVYIISHGPMTEEVERPTFPVIEEKKILHRIRMRKADVRDVFDFVVYGRTPDPMRGFNELQAFYQRMTSRQATTAGPVNRIPSFVNQQPMPAYQAIPADQTAFPAMGAESGNDIRLPGEFASQGVGPGLGGPGMGGMAGGAGFGGGQPGGGGAGFGGGQPGGGGLGGGFGGGQGTGLTGGQGLVPSGIDNVYYDPATNDLIVYGTEDAIQQLQERVRLFDVAPEQVQIKVEFITLSSSVSRSLGYDWLYQRGTMFIGNRPGSFARSGDPFFINYATGNVTARVRALIQEGFGKVVNSPMVRTLNNQPALVAASTVTTIFTNQVVSNTGGQVIIVPVLSQIEVTTGLTVTPRINGDGTITMFLSPQISDFGQIRRGPDGQEVPDQLFQTISVVARVKDGETIALGGITRNQDIGTHTRFPILGDLPIIGQFFRQNTRDRNNTELLIFVTPKILEEDETGG